jgi:hypothetical protein
VLFLDESAYYTITAQDRGSWVDIPFLAPISLFNGYAYEFGIVGFQHPVDSSFVGVSGSMMYAGEHSSFDELGLSTQSQGAPTWYYSTATPMVRMNFDPELIVINAIDDVNSSQFNVYPNPTNGVFTIELKDNVKKYDVAVNNVLGQTVYISTVTDMNTTIDLSSFEVNFSQNSRLSIKWDIMVDECIDNQLENDSKKSSSIEISFEDAKAFIIKRFENIGHIYLNGKTTYINDGNLKVYYFISKSTQYTGYYCLSSLSSRKLEVLGNIDCGKDEIMSKFNNK